MLAIRVDLAISEHRHALTRAARSRSRVSRFPSHPPRAEVGTSSRIGGRYRIPSLERRFRLEYQTLASLAHPRIVRVHDYGVDAAVGAYDTMDLLDGQDLDGITRPSYREVVGTPSYMAPE